MDFLLNLILLKWRFLFNFSVAAKNIIENKTIIQQVLRIILSEKNSFFSDIIFRIFYSRKLLYYKFQSQKY